MEKHKSKTINMNAETHEKVSVLASILGLTMIEVVKRAVNEYARSEKERIKAVVDELVEDL